MRDLEGKVILVTGGASGIGEAVVRSISALGAKVGILGNNMEACEKLAAELKDAKAYQADVTSLDMMEKACADIVADFGGLHGLVNSAGIGGEFGPLHACSPDNWQNVLNVNVTGTFYGIKAALKYMLEGGGGSIVNLSSLAGILAEPMLPAYVTSKHAVIGLTKSTAIDYGKQGIRCNAVCPAFIRTPMTEPLFQDPKFVEMVLMKQPTGRTVTAEEVAGICTFLLSDRSSGMTAGVHLADGGSAAI